MNRRHLTQKFIDSLRGDGTWQYHYDLRHPRLAVRVKPDGGRSFIFHDRLPGKASPTRMALAPITTSLVEVRELADDWARALKRGEDPRPKIAAAKHHAARQATATRDQTFAQVAEQYCRRHLPGKRTEQHTRRLIERILIPAWGSRPIGSIAKADVIRLIEGRLDAGTPRMAERYLQLVKHIFLWACQRDIVPVSPALYVNAGLLIPATQPRTSTLTDREIAANWKACERDGYPFGLGVEMLWLTACRLNEVMGARWCEIDLEAGIWTVPSERFKAGIEHRVYLSNAALDLLRSLPRFESGDFIFSVSGGRRPLTSISYRKRMLNELMAEELQGEPFNYRLHDIRRTVRSHLSALRVPDHICEMALGHARRGLQRIYDQHRYQDEQREALNAWATRLEGMIDPKENVVSIFSAS
jgi:integrase